MAKARDIGRPGAPTPRRRRPESRRVSSEEGDLWSRATTDVRKMSAEERAAPEEPVATVETPRIQRRPADPSPAALRRLPEMGHETMPGLDKRTAMRLRRGQLPIEGRIDLHGMTLEDAYRALDAFLSGARESGKRSVLVVTGKGYRPDGQVGRIRSAVPRWLNEPHNRARVLAFSYAIRRDGGEGALYVLLRKRR